MTEDRQAGPEVQRVIVCHIKQKTVDNSKRNKRNKPCRQFRKQLNEGHQQSVCQYQSHNNKQDGAVPKVFDIIPHNMPGHRASENQFSSQGDSAKSDHEELAEEVSGEIVMSSADSQNSNDCSPNMSAEQ